jgi:glucosylceramidase
MKLKLYKTLWENEAIAQAEEEIAVTEESAEPRAVEMNVLNVYPQVAYQTITGFGGAMTEAAGYALSQLSADDRQAAINAYFGEGGNGATVLRTHIDSCDFSVNMYQAVKDVNADPDLATFSLERDRKYIIPAIKDAMAASDKPISVLLSPWSPPAEWKTVSENLKRMGSVESFRSSLPPELQNTDLTQVSPMLAAMIKALENFDGSSTRTFGGHLKPEFYPSWAKYMTKYIQGYLDEGIPVKWVSIQNEAMAATPWDSCQWTAEEEKTFLRDHLYPEMDKAGLTGKVGIYIWDHNKERVFERASATIDAVTDPMVEGVAFHWYSGDHFDAVQMTHDAFPGKQLMFSEGCVEYSHSAGQSEVTFGQRYAHDMIGNLNAGMNTFLDWNMYLDEKGGPNHVSNFCGAPIMLDGKGGFEKHVSYYYIGQFSRYIQPGAVRIGHSQYTDKLEATAVRNPDGTLAVVMLNRSAEDIPVNLRLSGKLAKFTLAANSIATGIIE